MIDKKKLKKHNWFSLGLSMTLQTLGLVILLEVIAIRNYWAIWFFGCLYGAWSLMAIRSYWEDFNTKSYKMVFNGQNINVWANNPYQALKRLILAGKKHIKAGNRVRIELS